MGQHTTDHRGWQLSLYPGRTWVGCAKQERAPFDVILIKGFSGASVLAELRRKVDEIEDASTRPDATG
jgi:hypothetical protein